ncbi:Type IV inositol polyphosphate 5-phosphatase 9-like protein [Drosera capensis]
MTMWTELVANKIFKKKSVGNVVFDCLSCDESLVPLSFSDTFKYKLFVSTWNVGGVVPPDDLNLEELLETKTNDCDIYVLGFQEIVPLRASNVLGSENTKICMKWNGLIERTLNQKAEKEDMPLGYHHECILSKQMVGVFITVWVRSNIRQYIRHPSVSCVGCGIMGCLGNKGSVTVRFQLHETSFCFVCSHLASGRRLGDEKLRNWDASKIFSRTIFPSVPAHDLPENILDHDRVIFLGDLNYRISLPDEKIQSLVQQREWSELLQNDQLRIELSDGGTFENWQEGAISFAPTYKYHLDSDLYYGRPNDNGKKIKKKRCPAWCDRIIWYGKGLKQEEYKRGESKLSDHRPVKAIFTADVRVSFSLEQIKRQLEKCCMDDMYS